MMPIIVAVLRGNALELEAAIGFLSRRSGR